MPTRDMRTRLSIDGERQYRESVAAVNTGIRTLNTQMSEVTARFKDNGDSIEALNEKNSILNEQYQETVKKLELLQQAHKNAIQQVGEEDKRSQEWAQSINLTNAKLAELERQMKETQKGIDPLNRAIKQNEDAANNSTKRIGYLSSEMRALDAQYANNRDSAEYLTKKQEILDRQYAESVSRVNSLKAALKNVEAQSGKNSDEYMHMESSLNEARAEMYSAETATKSLNKNSLNLGDTIDNIASKFGIQLPGGVSEALNSLSSFDTKGVDSEQKTAKSMGGIIGSIDDLGGPLLTAAGLMVGIGAAALTAAADVEKSTTNMKVALGFTKDEATAAGDAVNKVYLYGITESRDDAEAAITAVMRYMGATGDAAVNLAAKLAAIKNNPRLGKDYLEMVRAASTMMETFGISGGEALDIIVTGLQSTADKNGDLLDVLNEYSPQFKRLGDDAEKMLTRIISATDAGTWSADKAADAYKEFYLRATDQNADFVAGLEELGLDADLMIQIITNGGPAAGGALDDILYSLQNVTSESKQSKIAAELFGSQWEDVGTKVILSMGNIDNKVIDTTGTANGAFKEMINTFSNKWEAMWRTLSSSSRGGEPFKGLFDNMDELVGESEAYGYDAGGSMMDAVADGINDNLDAPKQAIKDGFNKIIAAGDDALDRHSPPGVFIDRGEESMEAYGIGISNRIKQTQRDVQAAMTAISSGVLSGGSGVVINGGSTSYDSASGGDTYIDKIIIDAQSVKDISDIVRIAKGAKQKYRAGGGRK